MQKWEHSRVSIKSGYVLAVDGKLLGDPKSRANLGTARFPLEAGFPIERDYVNSLGENGWELVSTMPGEHLTFEQGTCHYVLFFKRPKPASE